MHAGITVVFTVDGDSPDGFVTITRTQILPVDYGRPDGRNHHRYDEAGSGLADHQGHLDLGRG